MEGEPHFDEQRFSRRVESPQERFRGELRGEVNKLLYETSDGLSYEVAVKILEKLDIKDRVDEIQRHKDDPSVLSAMETTRIVYSD